MEPVFCCFVSVFASIKTMVDLNCYIIVACGRAPKELVGLRTVGCFVFLTHESHEVICL